MELGTPQNLRLAPPHNTGQLKIFVKSKALYNHELDTWKFSKCLVLKRV